MTNSAVLEVRVGSRLWFDGEAWSVCQVNATTVRLHDGDGRYRTVTVAELVDTASPAEPGHQADPEGLPLPRNVAWASLPSKRRSSLDKEMTVFTRLLEVSGSGEQASAVRRAADDLGVSIRTVQRRLRRFQHLGCMARHLYLAPDLSHDALFIDQECRALDTHIFAAIQVFFDPDAVFLDHPGVFIGA